MKKIFFAAVIAALVFTGCGNKTEGNGSQPEEAPQVTVTKAAEDKNAGSQGGDDKNAEDKNVEIDVKALADDIKGGLSFDDELDEGMDVVFMRQYELEESDFVKQSSYFSTNATTEEIVAVECETEDAAKKVETAMKKRIDERKEVFADYAPDEVARLDKAVIKVIGRYAVLCVSAEPDKAEEIIDKYK